MIVRGIDVGTQLSHFADVEVGEDGKFRVVRIGEWRGDLPAADVVLIEFPSTRWYGRANSAIIIKVSRIAAVIALHESTKTRRVFLTDFDEWTGGRASRAELDSAFVRLIDGARVKGERIYVNEAMTNEHERDAALIAVYGALRYGEVAADWGENQLIEEAVNGASKKRKVHSRADKRQSRRALQRKESGGAD